MRIFEYLLKKVFTIFMVIRVLVVQIIRAFQDRWEELTE